jgi:hypothetical protein
LAVGGQFHFKERIVSIRGSYTYGMNKSSEIPDGADIVNDSKSIIGIGIYYMIGKK